MRDLKITEGVPRGFPIFYVDERRLADLISFFLFFLSLYTVRPYCEYYDIAM